MTRTGALPILTPASGLARYLRDIARFAVLEPEEECLLAKRWREHGDREAAHRLVTSHLRLVAKIAMGYRGYGLPVSEVISEGNVGLMKAVKRFEPEKGFRLATYAMWWIKASMQEYVLRSWSLVRMGTTANQRKLFFNLRKVKAEIAAFEDGDLRPDQITLIADRLSVAEQDVIDMNRRFGGDASLNTPIRDAGDAGEWQDWLLDDTPNQERVMVENESFDNRRAALRHALTVLNPLGAISKGASLRRVVLPISQLPLDDLCSTNSAPRGSEYARSRGGPSRRCRMSLDIKSPPWSGRKRGLRIPEMLFRLASEIWICDLKQVEL